MKKCLLFVFGLAFLLAESTATKANPTGGVVAAGAATIKPGAPGALTINQTSDKVIINWNSFSIGAGEVTRFIQPGAEAAALNRVLGGNPSAIYGTLQANGTVLVINPAGILVGPSGVINTHSFMGSTIDITDSAFLSGVGMKFSGNSIAGIKNEGTVNAIGGDIFLFAHTVDNSGLLSAPDGTVGLGAGSEILLKQSGADRFSVLAGNVSAPKTGTGVNNAGAVQAASAELKAAGGNMYALAINNGGIVRADTIVNQGGRIMLKASGGNIKNTGTLAATGANGTGGSITLDGGHNAADPATVTTSGIIDAHGTTGAGGTVNIFGDYVGLFGSALVDVSGGSGGGTALIGGDLHGENPNVQNAQRTFVDNDSQILADATASGNGGHVIVWSDEVTRFGGHISARGAGSGNGGFAEVSGSDTLIFRGTADLRGGPTGDVGTLLLDPKNITVASGGTNVLSTNSAFAQNAAGSVTFDPADLVTALGLAAVTLQANNDITFHDNVDASGNAADFGLTLQAGRSILIGDTAAVNLKIHGNFLATANDPGAIPANRDAGPGNFTMFDGSTIDTGSSLVSANRNISISIGGVTQIGDITIANLLTVPTSIGLIGGNVTLQNTAGNITVTGTIDASGRSTTANGANAGAAGNITLSITGAGAINTSAGTLIANGGSATGTGNPDGGAGGNVTITNGGGGASLGAITANGGAGNGNGNRGSAGTIIVTSAGPITVNSNLTALIGTNGTGGSPTPGAVTLAPTNGGGAVSGTGTIVTDNLNLNGVGAIGTSLSPLSTDVSSIVLTRGASAGAVFISEANSVGLSGNTGGGNLTVTANDVSVPAALNSGAGVVSIVAANNRSIVLGGGGTTNELTVSGADLQNITSAGGFTLKTASPGIITVNGISAANSGNVSGPVILDSATDVNFSTAASTFRNLDARAGAGSTININVGVASSVSQSYTADAINIGANLSSTAPGLSSLTLQPLTPTTAIGIGTGSGGVLIFDNTALGHLIDGFNLITFGRADGQHAFDIRAATFTDPVLFRTPVAGGSITVNGRLAGTNGASVTLTGSGATTTLNADIVTSGSAITINDSVILGTPGTVTLDTTAGGTSAAGAAIHITGAINDDTIPASSTLVLNSGTGGIATLDSDIGAGVALQGFTAIGSELVLKGANLRTDGGNVTFTGLGKLTLGNNVTIQTDVTADGIPAGSILFGAATTINGNAPGLTLSLNAFGAFSFFPFFILDPSGSVSLGRVGNTTPLGALSVSGGSLTLNNDINVDGVGGVNFSGVSSVTLNAATITIDSDATGGSTAAGNVNFGGAAIDGNAPGRNLVVDATADGGGAGGTVSLGPVGQVIQPLGSLAVSGASITAQAVTTAGNQTYTADAMTLNGNLSTSAGGTLTLQPLADATSIGIGTGAAGTLFFDNTALAHILDGFGSITFGRATGSHAIDVNGASFTDNVIFRTPSGTVTLHNTLQNDTGGGFNFASAGSVALANSATIDTDLAGGVTGAGAVDFGTTPVTANAANLNLTVDATADGGGLPASVTLAAVGTALTPLNTVTVSGNNLILNGTVQSSTAILSAAGTLTGAGSITATSLGLTIASGIGSVGTPLNTAVANLEASATTGGIFINNTGNLNIGGVTPTLNGIRVVTSGNIQINNTGSIAINSTGDSVSGPGNITIAANGATANLQTGGGLLAVNSTAGSLSLSAGQDLLLGTTTGPNQGIGDINGATGISMTAGRDIIQDANSFVTANGGSIVGTAGRNYAILHTLFTAPHIFGSVAMPITLTATSGTMTFDSAGGFIRSAGGTISLNAPSASAVLINDSVDAGGAGTITLNHNGALAGTGMFTAGTLNLQGNGAVGSSGGRLNTTVGTIVLNKTTGGSFVNELDGVNVQGTAPAFDLLAGGAIGQSGPLTIAGLAAFTATGGNAITLNDLNNDFGTLQFIGGTVTLVDKNALILGPSTATGNLTVTTTGALTQTGPITANVGGTTATFNNAGNSINLANANNDFNTVVFTGTDVTLRDQNGLNLGTSTATGNLTITANGTISQSGALTNNGGGSIASFNANGNFINLGNNNNDFTTAQFNGGDVILADKNALILGTSSSTVGNVTVVAGGNITESGVLTVNGLGKTATFVVTAPASDILLGTQANDIGSAVFSLSGAGTIHDLNFRSVNAAPSILGVSPVGNDVTFTFNNGGIILPALTVGNNLTVTANGGIGQSGAITPTGIASFTAGANPINLTHPLNDFGTASFNGSDVNVVDQNAIILGVSAITGNLFVNASGNITQSGVLTANGAGKTATFSPGAANDVLLGLNNNFTMVSVPTANNITLKDSDGFSLSGIKAAGTLNLQTSAGDITQAFPGNPAAGPTVEAQTLIGAVGGALVLGSLVDPTVQPANKIGTIGNLTHGSSASLTVPSSSTGAPVKVGLYIFDSDSTAYSAVNPNPVPGNVGAVLGLTISGAVSQTGALPGVTIIRTLGDMELVGASGTHSVSSSVAGSDIELSAENNGNFHNLLGQGEVSGPNGAGAISPGASRFLVFSTDSSLNFGSEIVGGQLQFNKLGADFLADQVSFNNHPTPIVKQDGTLDNGTGNGFVFVVKQTFIQQDEASKFFLDLLNLVVFSSVDASAKASEIPPSSPPTIWTSSYHLYKEEQDAKEKKNKQEKKVSMLSPFWEIKLEGNNSWTSSHLFL
jgi:filamentous hemagglutinin family protein